METVLPARTLGDKLSLLYVAGKHHGIEPDYQLTLGTMPVEELAELRSLLQPNVPPRRQASSWPWRKRPSWPCEPER